MGIRRKGGFAAGCAKSRDYSGPIFYTISQYQSEHSAAAPERLAIYSITSELQICNEHMAPVVPNSKGCKINHLINQVRSLSWTLSTQGGSMSETWRNLRLCCMRTHPRRDGTCAWRPWNAWLTSPIKLLICTLNSQFTGDPFLTTCINKLGLYAAGLFVSVITFLFSHQNQGGQTRLVDESEGALQEVDRFGRSFRSVRRDHQGDRRLLQKQRAHLAL